MIDVDHADPFGANFRLTDSLVWYFMCLVGHLHLLCIVWCLPKIHQTIRRKWPCCPPQSKKDIRNQKKTAKAAAKELKRLQKDAKKAAKKKQKKRDREARVAGLPPVPHVILQVVLVKGAKATSKAHAQTMVSYKKGCLFVPGCFLLPHCGPSSYMCCLIANLFMLKVWCRAKASRANRAELTLNPTTLDVRCSNKDDGCPFRLYWALLPKNNGEWVLSKMDLSHSCGGGDGHERAISGTHVMELVPIIKVL